MSDNQFEQFWKSYPRRVGKGAARKAFAKAIKLTTLETMLTAIEAYKRHKPGYADFCHPSTWLNQERFFDEWDTPQQSRNVFFASAERDLRDEQERSAARQGGDWRDDGGVPFISIERH